MRQLRVSITATLSFLATVSCGPATNAGTGDRPAAPTRHEARVTIDPSTPRHDVSPLLFGMHIEWVENGLGLLDPTTGRLRREAVELLRPLAIPLFRFPGGIHADYYNWRLGTGPAGERGRSRNAFSGAVEEHRFGSPELVTLLEALGADALITANLGTGTAAEAGAWAAHLRELGRPARFWEVGNETYLCDPEKDQPNGREIHRSAGDYAAAFPAYRRAILAATPDAKVGAIAHLDSGAFPLAPAAQRGWSEQMLRGLDSPADFIAVHNAYAPVILDGSVDFERAADRDRAYRSLYAAALQTADNLRRVAEMVDSASPVNRGAPIAVTELGPFFGLSSDRKTHAWYVDQTRTLAAALYTASVLHVLIDDPRVFMACYTNPIHRWFGGLVTDTDEGLITTPTYHLYSLYRTRFESTLVASSVSGPVFSAERLGIVNPHRDVPDLLAQAAVGDDGRRLTVMLVNRSLDRTLRTTVAASGFDAASADCRVIGAASPATVNGPALTRSTVARGGIAPQPLPCAPAPEIVLDIPPSSIVSLVAERR
ncbi:MAG: hypothetical protein MUC56_12670 [Thermoanaerobaculales bacterium]|jgi:alpha-N-arabinofuranosidase|nr:hypothetical protein [Thermoanaerobaculales bacterium]